jgi:anhydro-N-acetylmuramic acid kinase
MQQFNAIGVMSGSSLDGVDLCYAEFYSDGAVWTYKNCIAETLAYTTEWHAKLKSAAVKSPEDFYKTHVQYGHLLASLINEFIKKNKLKVDLISSHGHTIFHQPQHRFTSQIGDGAAIYAITGIQTVTEFRSVDVALGGQGAPLVPVGERDLFEDYGMFLNLGGIANISIFDIENKIRAYDISPCNMPLNMLCEKYFNTAYDKDGKISSEGKLNDSLLSALQELSYFSSVPPKSLGREFTVEEYLPVIEKYKISNEDKLFTITQHITDEISAAINTHSLSSRKQNILATGGGVYNKFLMELLRQKCKIEITVPSSMIVEFKEALIFAYLGVLRITNHANALSSVTNASRDSVGGALWG